MLNKTTVKDWILFIFILILGTGLRFYHYGQFPIAGETLDEYAWSTLGASLIQQNYPASWSAFAAYRGHETGYFYSGWPVVSPVLDHPPLFAILPGLFHALTVKWWQMPSILVIRFPMIGLGVVNLGLFYLVSRRWLNKPWSNIASLVYATAPLVVFSSRLVLAENLLQTILLLFLLVVNSSWLKRFPWWLSLLAAAAVLTKIAGLVLPFAILSWFLWRKQRRLAGYVGLGIGLGLVIWLTYGLIIDPHLFWAVQTAQGGRDIGLTTLINRWFLHPTLVRNFFFDGWWWLGWIGAISALFFLAKNKTTQLTSIMTLSVAVLVWHSLFIMLGVGESTFHGWYDFTILPLVIMWSIQFGQILWQHKLHLAWWLVWLLILPSIKWGISFYIPIAEISPLLIRLIILLGILPFILAELGQRRLTKIILIFLFLSVLTANVATVINMNDRVYSEFDTFYLTHRFN